MKVLVVGEDALCCALGERLVESCLPRWALSQPSIHTGGVTRLVKALPRYVEQAKQVQPVLCIADTDRRCALELLDGWLPRGGHPSLMLRLAVTESESWVLADRDAFANALQVSIKQVPRSPDSEIDPKRVVLTLASRSRRRQIREEVVSPLDPNKPGNGYNLHLCAFVGDRWDPNRAAVNSPSLQRAVRRLREFGGVHD